MTKSGKIIEILYDYQNGLIIAGEGERQIKQLILEAIGPDETYTITGHTYSSLGQATEHVGGGEAEWKDPRNELRAELRAKVQAW